MLQLDEDAKPGRLTAHCYRHDCLCPVLEEPRSDWQGLRGNVAGVNCYDWSSMGKQHGWLGSGAFPFLQWLRERLLNREDWIVVECVVGFDHEMLQTLLGKLYELHVLTFLPTLFGIPVMRNRKYMILLKTGSLRWHRNVSRYGIQETFEGLFRRRLQLAGDVLCRAPASMVGDSARALAVRRGFPPARASGKAWKPMQVICPGVRRRIAEHTAAAVAAGHGERPAIISNVSQTAPFSNPSALMAVPALLRGSSLWSMRLQRFVLPIEHLEIQGYNIFDQESKCKCDIAGHLRELPQAHIKSMAGNSMHLAAVGTVIMFVLGCTER